MTTLENFPGLEPPTEFEGTDEADLVVAGFNVAVSRARINTLGGNDVLNTALGEGRNRISLGDDNDSASVAPRDRVNADAGDDTIIGASRARLNGGEGNDLLYISIGRRVQATGGEGIDTFIVGNNPSAVITDFRLEDRLAIQGIENPDPQLLEQTFNEEEEVFQLLYDGDVVVNFSEIQEDEIGQFGPNNFSFLPIGLPPEFEGTDETDLVGAGINVAGTEATINTLGGDDAVSTGLGEGRNTITLGDGNDLATVASRDRVDGEAGDDTLIGANRARLTGGRGDDVLIGADRARVDGGRGNDILDLSVGRRVRGTGGAGEDHFIVGENPSAVITDFRVEDRLAIKGIENPDPQLLEQIVNPSGSGFQLLYDGDVLVNFSRIREEDVGQFGPDNFSFV
ncbi:hypothetical protein [Gloeocapsa sp. PCC 73106]|uniref:hypothetical protein n=1 Tax=Gloeocapsa sp. PCC 73106 TaxID=102232 RepID=UPI0002AD0F6E|nr:hypothetical protein [Gloeocapsa sp. PCC 73106]ELR96839.1 hypothetical protein GLO73106DRAFT_00006380 [Gloeocapsa sp. PCC 73106]